MFPPNLWLMVPAIDNILTVSKLFHSLLLLFHHSTLHAKQTDDMSAFLTFRDLDGQALLPHLPGVSRLHVNRP